MNYWEPIPAYAATTNDIGSALGLSDANLVTVVVHVVQLVLGFAPLVAVVFIILGGFMWLTSAGNEERIDKAKQTLSAAIVGLVIIFLAWAVVLFVAQNTLNAAQTNKVL